MAYVNSLAIAAMKAIEVPVQGITIDFIEDKYTDNRLWVVVYEEVFGLDKAKQDMLMEYLHKLRAAGRRWGTDVYFQGERGDPKAYTSTKLILP